MPLLLLLALLSPLIVVTLWAVYGTGKRTTN